jgi:allophanate hydrolase
MVPPSGNSPNLVIPNLLRSYAVDPGNLFRVLEDVRRKIEDYPDPALWISRVDWEQITARARALEASFRKPGHGFARYPLYGIPFAVKDNIDAEGLDTTAACPAFAYPARSSAASVAKLVTAGALLIGKTNMDQFATGLVGTRSPYGTVRNPFHPAYIPGGSSSGSAVAVAAGLVSFALGTDTAGSGRVPAGFNNVVGLKPTRGLISAYGLVPACRSLDCVSVFALTTADAVAVMHQCRGADPQDAFSRKAPADYGRAEPGPGNIANGRFHFGIPAAGQLEFFGDGESARLFQQAVERMRALGGVSVEIPFTLFSEAARLLYQGPWLAERQAAYGDFLETNPGDVLPVIHEVLARAKTLTALDAFRGYYRLRALRAQAEGLFRGIDFLMTPTAPTHYRLDEVEADPVGLNTRLGYYTNFVNLMDLCALAVPSGMKGNGLPFGVTLIAPAFQEMTLAAFGAGFHAATGLPMGAGQDPLPEGGGEFPAAADTAVPGPAMVRLAVAGLHLSGQPLNHQLLNLRARLVGAFRTPPCYRLYALERPGRKFPGMVRQTEGGGKVELEVWELTPGALGEFLEYVKEPLCLGTVELEGGEKVKGFLCEPSGIGDAPDITAFGGWKAYLAETRAPGPPL